MPENGAQLVKALAEANWLPKEHVSTCSKMIRFRNLVVRLYSDVDDRQIYDILRYHLDDFRMFIADAWRIVQQGPRRQGATATQGDESRSVDLTASTPVAHRSPG